MVTNTEEQRRAERKAKKEAKKAEKAKRTELQKLEDQFSVMKKVDVVITGVGSAFLWVSAFIIAITISKSSEIAYGIILCFCIGALIDLIFLWIIKYKLDKEKDNVAKYEVDKLNANEFKEIKLKEQGKYFSNVFGNNKIEAKIYPENDEIVILKFCFVDDSNESHHKIIPFNKEYLIDTIEEVVDIVDNN